MQKMPIAKITRPKLAAVHNRTRLFKLLDLHRDRPVTWISSPAGSGKTTLVGSYLDARKLPCLWYEFDEGDGDPATFFYYMGLAAKKAAPRFKRSLPLLTPEYLPSVPVFSKRYFENLCSRLKAPFVLVFDNYQTVPVDSLFHDAFREGLSSLTEGIRVIVISRAEPPQQFASLRAGDRLDIIGWDDLRLMPEESKGIARLAVDQKLPAKSIEKLHEQVHGWTAGLILLAKDFAAAGKTPEHLDRFTHEEVFEYFASELFDRAEPHIRDFLLKTAFLPIVTIAAAEELTGMRQADRILTTLHRRNYFTEKRLQPELVYQYHPLFRAFLLVRVNELVPKKEMSHLRLKAAALLERSSRIEDAADLLIDAGEEDKLAALILNHAESLIRQGRNNTLEKWLSSISPATMTRTPWLLYWQGVSWLPLDPKKSRSYLEAAWGRFNEQEDVVGMFLAWTGVVESIWLAFEDMSCLDRWIDVFADLFEKFGKSLPVAVTSRAAAVMLKLLIQTRFTSPDFDQWKDRALSAQDRNTRIEALLNVAAHYGFSGDVAKANGVLPSLNGLLQSPEVSPFQRLQVIFHEVLIYALSGSYDRCLKAVQQGLKIADASGVHVLDFMIVGNGLVAALNYGDLASVKALSAKIPSEGHNLQPWERSFYHFLKSLELIHGEHYSRAGKHADEAVAYADVVGFAASRIWCRLVNVFILNEQKDYDRAENLLRQACRIAHDFGGALLLVDYFFIEAYYALERNQKAAITSLRKALSLGKEKGLMISFIPLPSAAAARLCAKAIEYGIETVYVRELIRTRKLAPETPPYHLENWPWPYRISTLGQFSLIRDDTPIRLSGKAPKKPLELLKALIAFGAKSVSEEQLSEALWPDAEGDLAHRSFVTNLHRLRQLLGSEKVLQLQEGRLTFDPRYCWVDVWAFDLMIEQAGSSLDREKGRWGEGGNSSTERATGRRGDGGMDQHTLERAIALYTGHFLSGDNDKPWAISLRERLRSKYLRAVSLLGDIHEQSGKYAKAVEVYERGLDVDDLAEEFYQRLMECYHRMGRQAEVVKVYQRCRDTLAASLGIEPGSETGSLYRNIVG